VQTGSPQNNHSDQTGLTYVREPASQINGGPQKLMLAEIRQRHRTAQSYALTVALLSRPLLPPAENPFQAATHQLALKETLHTAQKGAKRRNPSG
jgi:hypothetical protein